MIPRIKGQRLPPHVKFPTSFGEAALAASASYLSNFRESRLKSTQRLLRSLLHRARSETDVRLAIEAAEISERTLMAAVSALGIERLNGEWRLPG